MPRGKKGSGKKDKSGASKFNLSFPKELNVAERVAVVQSELLNDDDYTGMGWPTAAVARRCFLLGLAELESYYGEGEEDDDGGEEVEIDPEFDDGLDDAQDHKWQAEEDAENAEKAAAAA